LVWHFRDIRRVGRWIKNLQLISEKINRAKILNSGCDDYVSKPINVLDFIALVERYTKKAATNAEALAGST